MAGTGLTEAHVGFLFRAPDHVKAQFPQFKAVESYANLMKLVKRSNRLTSEAKCQIAIPALWC